MSGFEKTRTQARQAVEDIKAKRGDDEMAHSWEDGLHVAVLWWIAKYGDERSAELAKIALETQEIDFARWCA